MTETTPTPAAPATIESVLKADVAADKAKASSFLTAAKPYAIGFAAGVALALAAVKLHI